MTLQQINVIQPSTHVVISGHADERGKVECNLAMRYLGASAVADFMVATGIDGKISHGRVDTRLKGSNDGSASKV